ncbi:MAG: 23S ribosomal RNA methyltransferase Erm [candidate division WOR-3 bacterium]|nr:MAG: 23S ribosomal RNA methyltransferase Erm [candidate division WOR-3 bacterium]
MVRKRIRLAQNFFRDRKLVRSVVRASMFGQADVVYEVGPGEGIVTRELARYAGRVVAIEKDPVLAARLSRRFCRVPNVSIIAADFTRYRIPVRGYRVFANLPFNITARVMKRILFGLNPPDEAHLVVQKEAAEKFSGHRARTEVSVLARPWFLVRTVREFRRTDFEPRPGVDTVLLHIAQRAQPLVRSQHAGAYRRFVRLGFEAWKKDLRTAYKRVFTYQQWKRLSSRLSFPVRAKPSELGFEQWLELFEFLRSQH